MTHNQLPVRIEDWINMLDPYNDKQSNWFIKMIVQQSMGLKDKLCKYNKLLNSATTMEYLVSYLTNLPLPFIVALHCINTYIEGPQNATSLIEPEKYHI